MNKNNDNIKVQLDLDNPEPLEIIAHAIIKVSEAAEKLNDSRLSRRAIVLLLYDMIGASNISKKQIGYVLDYAPKLKDEYLRKIEE